MIRLSLVIAALAAVVPASASEKSEKLCGWIQNPTPANWWLTDSRGEWIINTQGGAQAEGDPPTFTASQWVRTQPNGYGYGCGCIEAIVDASEKRVLKIVSARALPLKTCRQDKALTEPKE